MHYTARKMQQVSKMLEKRYEIHTDSNNSARALLNFETGIYSYYHNLQTVLECVELHFNSNCHSMFMIAYMSQHLF